MQTNSSPLLFAFSPPAHLFTLFISEATGVCALQTFVGILNSKSCLGGNEHHVCIHTYLCTCRLCIFARWLFFLGFPRKSVDLLLGEAISRYLLIHCKSQIPAWLLKTSQPCVKRLSLPQRSHSGIIKACWAEISRILWRILSMFFTHIHTLTRACTHTHTHAHTPTDESQAIQHAQPVSVHE